MTDDDVNRLEKSLGVNVPSDYRHLLLHFPIRFDQGTSSGALWDDADALIKRNKELRTQRHSLGVDYAALPEPYLFIGDDEAGWQFLIDIGSEPSMVHVMEFEDTTKISPVRNDAGEAQSLNDWFHAHLLELRDSGIDITSEKPPHYTGWGCIIGTLTFCVVAAIAIALMVAGIQSVLGQ